MKLAIVDDNEIEQEIILNTLNAYHKESGISLEIQSFSDGDSFLLLSTVNHFVFHFIPLHRILMTRDFYSVIVESYWIWIISRQWKLIILKWPTPSVFQSKRKDVNRYANSIFNIIFWNLRRNENECSYLRKIPKKNTMVICPFRLTTIVLKSRCFYNVNSMN